MLQIRGIIDSGCLGTITNTATVESPTPSLTPNDRIASQDTTVRASAHLTITKTALPNPVPTGGVLTYTLIITNSGPSAATNAELFDTMPICVLDPTYSLDGATWLPWAGALPLGSILPATTLTVWIRGIVDIECVGVITNVAIIISPTPDPIPDHRIATTDTSVITLANLSISKVANVTSVSLDDLIIYTVTLLNKGKTDAFNVVLKDNLSPATTLIDGSVTVGGVPVNHVNLSNGVNVGTIPPSAQVVIKYTAKVISGACDGKITNKAYTTYYKLLHTNLCCPAQTRSVSAVVDVTITNFKQLSLSHTLNLAPHQPAIKVIDESISEILIKDYYVVTAPKGTSIEGQRLSGYKLVIHGILKVAISYTTTSQNHLLYAADWEVPFSTFIILPSDYKPNQLFGMSTVIENTDAALLDEKTIDVCATVLLVAKHL